MGCGGSVAGRREEKGNPWLPRGSCPSCRGLCSDMAPSLFRSVEFGDFLSL